MKIVKDQGEDAVYSLVERCRGATRHTQDGYTNLHRIGCQILLEISASDLFITEKSPLDLAPLVRQRVSFQCVQCGTINYLDGEQEVDARSFFLRQRLSIPSQDNWRKLRGASTGKETHVDRTPLCFTWDKSIPFMDCFPVKSQLVAFQAVVCRIHDKEQDTSYFLCGPTSTMANAMARRIVEALQKQVE